MLFEHHTAKARFMFIWLLAKQSEWSECQDQLFQLLQEHEDLLVLQEEYDLRNKYYYDEKKFDND